MSKQTILELAKQLQEGYGDVINVTFHEGGEKYDNREGMNLSNGKTMTLRGTCHVDACVGYVQADIHLYHVDRYSDEELLEIFVHEMGHYLAYRKRFSFAYENEDDIISWAESVSDEVIPDKDTALTVLQNIYASYHVDASISIMLAEIDAYSYAIQMVEALDEAGILDKKFYVEQQVKCYKTYLDFLDLPEERREEFAAFIEELKQELKAL